MNIVEVDLDSLDLRYGKLRARRPAVEKRLMASLEEAGQQSPVIVVAGEKPGRWVLIEGRKRVRALKRLKAEAVKAVVWELAPAAALIAAYQLQDGTGYNALEEGWLVWELVRGDGLSLAEVGRRLERSKGWVSGRLGLIEGLPEQVLEGVLSGQIGAYVATRYLFDPTPYSSSAPASRCDTLDAPRCAHRATPPILPSAPLPPVSKSTPEFSHAALHSADRVLKVLPFHQQIRYFSP